MQSFTYRLANNSKKDIDKLYEISVEFESFNQENSTRPSEHFSGKWQDYFREEIVESLTNKNSWVYLAETDGKVIGFVYARVCDDCYKYVIEELFVRKSYRGIGVGKKLIDLAVQKGREFEYPIVVEVFDWNKRAISYYQKHGFQTDGVILKLETSNTRESRK